MSVGDIVAAQRPPVRALQPGRGRAGPVAAARPPPGRARQSRLRFGTPGPPDSRYPLLDEQALGAAGRTREEPPPVAVFPVDDPPPIVHAQPASARSWSPATARAWSTSPASARLDERAASSSTPRRSPTTRAALRAADRRRRRGARRHRLATAGRARRWSTVRDNVGYTERAGETPLVDDLTDTRLDLFPDAGDDAYTVVDQRGRAGRRHAATATHHLHARGPAARRVRRRPRHRVARRRVRRRRRRADPARARRARHHRPRQPRPAASAKPTAGSRRRR